MYSHLPISCKHGVCREVPVACIIVEDWKGPERRKKGVLTTRSDKEKSAPPHPAWMVQANEKSADDEAKGQQHPPSYVLLSLFQKVMQDSSWVPPLWKASATFQPHGSTKGYAYWKLYFIYAKMNGRYVLAVTSETDPHLRVPSPFERLFGWQHRLLNVAKETWEEQPSLFCSVCVQTAYF